MQDNKPKAAQVTQFLILANKIVLAFKFPYSGTILNFGF
ncbi:hypothetical protein GXM_00806 [Nostoc sphaeroides CCNUC1]|uniref:Uncharacterized protein n=1 Tax=Nostoc sphaeroides CCNUC1 TaxID=2653204 RepID=A0A5P8VSB1_9NOSO|nr:hypothetical protein GXM_00806 [Nostoc sphaeroides CCNUC1]